MPSATLRLTPSTVRILALLAATVFSARPSVAQEGGAAPHMVIVGVDGLSPDGVQKAETPTLDALMQRGAHTFHTVAEAVAYVKENKPLFTFIHLDHVDHAGHEYGHGAPPYCAAVEEADRLIGKVLAGLDAAGILDQTMILVTADHGGIRKGHGSTSLAEMEIPWIIAGPGVRAGETITFPVNTFDTAATVAYVLGVTPPACWIARPVLAAFTGHGPAGER